MIIIKGQKKKRAAVALKEGGGERQTCSFAAPVKGFQKAAKKNGSENRLH